jgi:phosphoglycerol transferase MdoB-like AlkP superfamily enzyme
MKQVSVVIRFLLAVHVIGIMFFTLFRLVLYIANAEQVADVAGKGYFLLQSLLRGLLFDNVVTCYTTLVPLVVLGICSMSGKIYKSVIVACSVFFIFTYAISFVVAIADIPYYEYFNAHLDIASLAWLEFGTEARDMIFHTPQHYPYHALCIVSIVIFAFAVFAFGKKLLRNNTGSLSTRQYSICVPTMVILCFCCCFGIRSSFKERAIRVDDAYFCNVPLFNHVALNPVFYFVRSYIVTDKPLAGAEDFMAIHRAQKALGRTVPALEKYPVSRVVQTDGPAKYANVIIVLLESMSSACLEYEYQGNTMTPFLHSLIEKSYYFEHFYSAGIHTNNGIVASLYGFPAIAGKTTMMEEISHYYMGLPYYLREQRYRNLFFVGGRPSFHHMQSFLSNNCFDRIYSSFDLPDVKPVNTWGVADEHLFDMGIAKLREIEAAQPFMATFLTVSNHRPYVVPEQFKKVADDNKKRIVAYVDHCVKNFLNSAAKEAWYHNTIFVFLGDHGKKIGEQKYDISLTYNHIPCIIFSPLFTDAPKRFEQFGGQIDLFPTLLGLLNIPYVNNSLGIDLLKENRPCMFFVSDSQLGCINSDYLYVRNFVSNTDFLYDLHREQPDNLAAQYPELASEMGNYGLSMTIAADYLIRNKKTRIVAK